LIKLVVLNLGLILSLSYVEFRFLPFIITTNTIGLDTWT